MLVYVDDRDSLISWAVGIVSMRQVWGQDLRLATYFQVMVECAVV